MDLEHMGQADLAALARETTATESALLRARKSVQDDVEIKRLRRIGQLLGRFAKDEDEFESPSA